MTLEDEPPRLVGVQYATGEEWRNSSKKNEEAKPKQKKKTTKQKPPSCGCDWSSDVCSSDLGPQTCITQ